MMKKIVSLLLCLVMLAGVFVGCGKERDQKDKGAYISMYLTDPIYDFDPLHAYENEAAIKVVGLMFDTLFVLNEKGKVEKSLVEKYTTNNNEEKKEYTMILSLKKDACWSDGTAVSANDVVYAWKRILEPGNSSGAAALLFDIKNARAVKEGNLPADNIGISALNNTDVQIQFEKPIDYEHFTMNLTSLALAPIREDVVKKTEMADDWAKKATVMVSSGPFRLKEIYYDETSADGLKMVLERNQYYYRDIEKDEIDESVTPYRLIIDYTKTDAEIMQAYKNGEIFYVGNIPLSVRGNWKDSANITDSLSTHTYILNQNAVVRYYDEEGFKELSKDGTVYDASLVEGVDGDKIFANANVRKALSLVLDRDAIAKAVVFGKAASGLVPYGVFDSTSAKKSFREVGGSLLASSANKAQAEALLSGIDTDKYMFAITVPSYDDVHMKIAEMVQMAWESLGFHVAINAITPVDNQDDLISIDDILTGVKDDIFMENYREGLFEVVAIDYTAYSTDAFSMLAPFAQGFSGNASAKETNTGKTDKDGNIIYSFQYINPTHSSGYTNENYVKLIEEIFANKDIKSRATKLHEAEKMLLDDAVVIPVIFNQNATLINEEMLSKYEVNYYGFPVMTKMELKDYLNHIPAEEEIDTGSAEETTEEPKDETSGSDDE